MMEIREERGNHRVYLKIQALDSNVRQGIREGFFDLGRDLQTTTNREILRKPKKGRTYLVRGPSWRRRRHVASAPGETHANLSGTLRKSLGWHVTGGRTMEFGYGVGHNAAGAPDYAEFVEEGTSRMKPRPSLGNAVRSTTRNAEQHFANGILRAMKK